MESQPEKPTRRYLWEVTLLTMLWFVQPGHAANTNLRIGGSGTDLATFRIIADEFEKRNPGVKIEIPPSLGSGGAVKALRAGWLHLGLLSRPLKLSEESPEFNAVLYARTPLVFAVSRDTAVSSVSLEQVAAIYRGDLTEWDNGAPIRPILRPKSDSDSILLLATYPQLARAFNKARARRGLPLSVTDQDTANKLENLPGAFATTTLSLIRSGSGTIKALALDGISPSVESISNGHYRMHKELYLLLPASLPPQTARFVEFVGSKKGFEILQRTGHQVIEFKHGQ